MRTFVHCRLRLSLVFRVRKLLDLLGNCYVNTHNIGSPARIYQDSNPYTWLLFKKLF